VAAAVTFDAVARDYLRMHVEGLATASETASDVNNRLIPRWRGRPIGEITRRDIIELADDLVAERLRGGANRILDTVRGLFNWALSRDVIQHSPYAGVKKPAPEQARDRVLGDDEIRAIWRATYDARVEPAFGGVVRMLLATGQRRSEVARMRWEDVDLERRVWLLLRERRKQTGGAGTGRSHTVPLNRVALALLAEAPRLSGCPWVFSTDGKAPRGGFTAGKARLDAVVGTSAASWVLHDLRRTAASKMTEIGVTRFVVERVLGHADRGVTAIYDRHSYLPEKRDALDRWNARLRELTGGKARSK
jgi:integrase